MSIFRISLVLLAVIIAVFAAAGSGYAQMQGEQIDLDDATQLAYAYAMNDLSVEIVAVIYNYAGMVWESFDGGTLDSHNAQLELVYVENVLFSASESVGGIVDTVEATHPVYEILYPHMDCYYYFFDYVSALYDYFGDPSDDNYQLVVDSKHIVEPYMEAIGLDIKGRGE